MLDYTDNQSPKVCFLNLSPQKLNRMEIGTAYTENYELYTSDLQSFDMTNFVDITAGNYGLFWETIEKGNNDQHLFYPNADGSLYLHSFNDNKWYLFIAYAMDGSDHANLFEITPG
jgi:hypothetical protein